MPTRPPLHRPAGQRTKRERDREADARRGSARQRGYTSKWEKARATFLTEHPLCERCQAEGKLTPATVVNHHTPHRGDQGLFWSRSNWEPTCKPHHDRDIQREERQGTHHAPD